MKRYLKNFVGFGFFRSKAFFSVKNRPLLQVSSKFAKRGGVRQCGFNS
jgi:hypothetical protein